jgi:hypothetical protein
MQNKKGDPLRSPRKLSAYWTRLSSNFRLRRAEMIVKINLNFVGIRALKAERRM